MNKYQKEEFKDDCSPEVWEGHYKYLCKNSEWEFMQNFKFKPSFEENDKIICGKVVWSNDASPLDNSFKKSQFKGDVDFNFGDGVRMKNKYGYYKNILEKDNTLDEKEKKGLVDRLNECKDNKYSRENLSLIFAVGGLNNVKGSLSQDNRALDRFDVFIYVLDDYFSKRLLRKNGEEEDYMHMVYSFSWKNCRENRICLYEYFNNFSDIYDYCKCIYGISDRDLVHDFIKSGKKPINSAKRVEEYIDLAERYWTLRGKFLDKIIYK